MDQTQGCFRQPVRHTSLQLLSHSQPTTPNVQYPQSHSTAIGYTRGRGGGGMIVFTFDLLGPGTQKDSYKSVSLLHPFISTQFDSK